MSDKDGLYKEPVEWTDRRNNIRKNQVLVERLQELVSNAANERSFQEIIKQDLSFLSDYFQYPQDEYICLSEVPIGGGIVDFIVLTSRSRMSVKLIEIKGADFYTTRGSHYKGMNAHINDAVHQIENHIQYIERNYDAFRKYIHNIRHQVINGGYKSNFLLGPKGYLEVDPNKDIHIGTIVIGGRTKDEYMDSYERTRFEKRHDYWLNVYSWESFLRGVDKSHGHYF